MCAAAHLYHKAAYEVLKKGSFATWHICNSQHARRGASVQNFMRLSISVKASEHAAQHILQSVVACGGKKKRFLKRVQTQGQEERDSLNVADKQIGKGKTGG